LIKLKEKKLSRFAELYLWAENAGRGQLNDAAYGGGKPGLNLANVRELIIGVPGVDEQSEIVRRVEDLFAFADQLELKYKVARENLDKMTRAILAKAFRGELVPQDTNDEPAEKLLELIKSEESNDQEKLSRGRKKVGSGH